MSTTITIGSRSFTLCAMPSQPGPSDIEIGMSNTVAVVTSPFTKAEQTQEWPGADAWDGTITLPPMNRLQAWPWEGFLAELCGRLNVFQLGDPRAAVPMGNASGTPLVSTVGAQNLAMTRVLHTKGWTASTSRLLLPGDYLQIGYRLHRVTTQVDSDSSGNATLNIFPSLREQPADNTPLTLARPRGLFRLADNRRSIQSSPTRLTTTSIKFVEAR